MRVAIAVLLATSACYKPPPDASKSIPLPTDFSADGISVIHDAARGVTCWIFHGYHGDGGISCLPDKDVRK